MQVERTNGGGTRMYNLCYLLSLILLLTAYCLQFAVLQTQAINGYTKPNNWHMLKSGRQLLADEQKKRTSGGEKQRSGVGGKVN